MPIPSFLMLANATASYMCMLALLTATAWAEAQPTANTEIGGLIQQALRKGNVVGGAWAVIEAEGTISPGFYGVASDETGDLVTSETRFRAGSVSKTLTALLALRLCESGSLSLDQPVEDYLEHGKLQNRWAPEQSITLAHLLEHTSGLPGSNYRDYATSIFNATSEQFLSHAGSLRTRWQPGMFYSYSNTGYGVAGAVLERATGESFDKLMDEQVFEPLGVETGSFLTDGSGSPTVATGHDSGGAPQPTWAMPMRAAGSLVITPGDLAKVVLMFIDRGSAADGAEFLAPATIERMEQSETSLAAQAGIRDGAYGLGQFGFVVNDRIYRGHWGKTDGFLTNYGYLPNHGVGFVLMINTDAPQAMAECRRLIGDYLTRDIPKPPQPEAITSETKPDASGAYINFTHDMPMRDWLFRMLDQKRITRAGDSYLVESVGPHGASSETYRYVEGGGLKGDSIPVATAAIITQEDRTLWIDGEAYRRVPALEAAARRWGFLIALLVAAIVVVVQPLAWIVRRVRRRNDQTKLQRVVAHARLFASLGLLVATILFLKFGLLGSSADLIAVGTVSPVSVAIAIASGSFVLFGLVAGVLQLVALIKSRSIANLAFAFVTAPLTLVAAHWLASGWGPLITWL